jgi:hypothetical protein
MVFHLESAAYFTRAPGREAASDKKMGEHPLCARQLSSSGVNAGLVKRRQYWIRHDAGSKKGGKTRPVVVVMV